MNNESEQAGFAKTIAVRHLRFGWWSLLCFLTLGIFLEAMHGFKIDWYLNSNFETRRLMWTLGHAHGTLFSIIHIVFAVTLFAVAVTNRTLLKVASASLFAGGLLLPLGFFLGGVFLYGGDPGLGVFLAPVGALFMLIAVFLIAYLVSTNIAKVEDAPGESLTSEPPTSESTVESSKKKKRRKNR